METEVVRDKWDDIFTYHAPNAEQILQYKAIREAGLALVRTIIANTPGCPDQSAAIRHVREAVMTANAAIALGGKS